MKIYSMSTIFISFKKRYFSWFSFLTSAEVPCFEGNEYRAPLFLNRMNFSNCTCHEVFFFFSDWLWLSEVAWVIRVSNCCEWHWYRPRYRNQSLWWGKLGRQGAICWLKKSYTWYMVHLIVFRNKTFLFVKIEIWNFQHLFD